jgi:hypothetical protein
MGSKGRPDTKTNWSTVCRPQGELQQHNTQHTTAHYWTNGKSQHFNKPEDNSNKRKPKASLRTILGGKCEAYEIIMLLVCSSPSTYELIKRFSWHLLWTLCRWMSPYTSSENIQFLMQFFWSRHKNSTQIILKCVTVQIFGDDSNKPKFDSEEIKRRLNSGNACYHSVQSLLSSRLLSKNLKIRIYKTIFFPVVLYGCETWSLTLRVEHRLRVFENRVLRRIFGPKRDSLQFISHSPFSVIYTCAKARHT